MPPPDRFETTNTLLAAITPDDLALLAPHFEQVALPKDFQMVKANEPVTDVYFPEDGVVSISTTMMTGGPTEVGIFGREGVSASFLLLGSDQSPHNTFVQVPGKTGLRIGVDAYLGALERSATMRTVMLRYIQTFLVQGAQSTATNARHRVEVRLARWLLMCHDRIDGDDIPLTHEFMGMMIAAERSGVTVTLHILEGAGMISSKRGRVVIRDRDKLEDLAGDSYGIPEAEYRRLIGPLGRTT